MTGARRQGPASVDQYLAGLPEDTRRPMEQVRAAIRAGPPEAEECLSYNMPAYRLNGRLMLYFAAFKEHYSLFCPQPAVLYAAFEQELAPYPTSKSTIRFPLSEPVPVDLLTRTAGHRVAEVSARPTSPQRRQAGPNSGH